MNVYYSISNDGAGAAYPQFFTTQELADWDQDHLDLGWGEPCTGCLELFSETDIKCPEAMDAIAYWLHRTDDDWYEPWNLRDEFLAAFFVSGLPTFVVRLGLRGDNAYYDIYVGSEKKGERFGYNSKTDESETTEAGRVALEAKLNA